MDKQKIKITGEITAKFYNQATLNFFQKLWNKCVLIFGLDKPKWYILGKLAKIDRRTNVICNAGFNAIARRLVGTMTYTGEINKMALGTGTGTPAASDTTLFTEAYRNDTASGTASSNIAYLTAYYTETECSGTYTEFGNFIDGAAGAGTGQLWSHVAGLNWVKDNVTVLVVDCKYTFTTA